MDQGYPRGFQNPRKVDEARRLFFRAVRTNSYATQAVRLPEALERILARDAIARQYLPATDVAVVDGYAVRSADLRGASLKRPVFLKLVGESRLGEVCHLQVRWGETVTVATGSSVPKGGDAVVMVERATRPRPNMVQFRTPVSAWQGITRKGDDVRPGSVVLGRGSRLRPEDIGALKALGLERVEVLRKVRVGLLSTGNELVDTYGKKGSARIVDLNRPILSAMVREAGAHPVDLGIARDNKAEITAALKDGLVKSDVVLVTAGSSVGRRDLVPECINRLGRPGVIVHGVAMKPAMPTGLAVVEGKPIVSLPGFPVSAMIAFRAFVRPLLTRLVGATAPLEPTVLAVLEKKITGTPGHRTFVRVLVRRKGDRYVAAPLRRQRSSQLMSMVHANGIVTLPESVHGVGVGKKVLVSLTGDISD
jgi:molybdopterin molybdotransferase